MTFNNSKFNKTGFNVNKTAYELIKAAADRILTKEEFSNNTTKRFLFKNIILYNTTERIKVAEILSSAAERILEEEKTSYSETERKLIKKEISNNTTERFLLSLIQNNNTTERFLFNDVSITNTTLRGLGNYYDKNWPAVRILPEYNQLFWRDRRPKKQLFKPNLWSYTENTVEDFELGEHLLTKAFEEDYLGLIDDYAMCWGPSEEGDGLSEYQHVYDSRVYIVYTTETGKINFAKSDIGGNEIVNIEELTFAPSGSENPSITFNEEGHYEIAVEVKPSGTDTKEIWLFSYPYEADNVREICKGVKPNISLNHKNNLTLFYQSNNDKTTIKYRTNDDYSKEYNLEEFDSQREVEIIESKLFKSEEKEINYLLSFILFAYRSDDTFPYKYIVTYDMKTKPQYKNEIPKTNKINLDSIEWDRIYHLDENIEEKPTSNVDLDNIYWQKITGITNNEQETPKATINLDSIEWDRIYHLDENQTEKARTGEISLDSILWIEA